MCTSNGHSLSSRRNDNSRPVGAGWAQETGRREREYPLWRSRGEQCMAKERKSFKHEEMMIWSKYHCEVEGRGTEDYPLGVHAGYY